MEEIGERTVDCPTAALCVPMEEIGERTVGLVYLSGLALVG